jgi:glycosyltransferase involved in cell wall biosynthesis
MRVLYVNHTAEVSGGERSLLSLLAALDGSVEPHVACPEGPLSRAVEQLGISTSAITGTAGSLRLHPLYTPKTVAELGAASIQVRSAARRQRADLIHANSIRAGLVLGLGRLAPAARIVHVRDCLPPGVLTSVTMRTIAATASTVIANSRYTAASVRAAAPAAHIEVVHNSVDLARWDPSRIDRETVRARLGEAGGRAVLLGVVAQLSPWKGQDVAVEALAMLRERGLDAHLLLIGSAKFVARATRFDNEAYVTALKERIRAAGLEDRVSWLGEREDVPELMAALDVLLLPSHEEPFGRAVIEAMALGVPVLATAVGGPAEIIVDGREGYLLPPLEPRAWADAVERVMARTDGGRALGEAGRLRVAEAFTAEHHARAVLAVYERALARAPA